MNAEGSWNKNGGIGILRNMADCCRCNSENKQIDLAAYSSEVEGWAAEYYCWGLKSRDHSLYGDEWEMKVALRPSWMIHRLPWPLIPGFTSMLQLRRKESSSTRFTPHSTVDKVFVQPFVFVHRARVHHYKGTRVFRSMQTYKIHLLPNVRSSLQHPAHI